MDCIALRRAHIRALQRIRRESVLCVAKRGSVVVSPYFSTTVLSETSRLRCAGRMRCKAPTAGFATHSSGIVPLRCKAGVRRRKSLFFNDGFERNEPIALRGANALQSPQPALQRIRRE